MAAHQEIEGTMKTLRVLLVEDVEEDALLLVRRISKGGYDALYERVDTASAFSAALAGQSWDVIIADFTMPGFGAFEALQILKESGHDLPFIIVSGHIGEDQLVAAMKAGASDYLMKGNLSRLVPAIDRELREAAERSRRRQAELSMSQGKKEWEAVFDSVSDLIVLTDLDGTLIRCNKKVIEYFLTSYSELIGRNIVDIFFGAQEPPDQLFRLTNTATVNEELTFPQLEGWFTVSSYPYYTLDNQLSGLVHIIKDITKRKRIEQEKQAIDRELLTLYAVAFRLNSTRSSKKIMIDLLFQLHNMLQVDLSSIHLLDRGVLKLRASLGLSRGAEESLKKLPQYTTWVKQVLAGKPFRSSRLPYRLPARMVKAAQDIGVRAWCAVPLKIGSDVIGVLMVAHRDEKEYSDREVFLLNSIASQLAVLIENHTLYDRMKEKAGELERSKHALKENLQEVKRANIELGKLNAAKNSFIGMASHELKTPITSILGGVQFLLLYNDIPLTPEQRDMFISVYEGTLQLKDLVDNLLSISRIEANGLVLQSRPLPLMKLAREVYDTFALPLSRRRIDVIIEGDDEPVVADEAFTRLAIRNLMENAIKFTPDGGEIRLVGQMMTRDQVLEHQETIRPFYPDLEARLAGFEQFYCLTVSDTGIGVPAEERLRIFEKFYSVGDLAHHSSGKTDFMSKGSGLGLSIVKGLMDAHQGLVWVDGANGESGSVFSLLFPCPTTDSPSPADHS